MPFMNNIYLLPNYPPRRKSSDPSDDSDLSDESDKFLIKVGALVL